MKNENEEVELVCAVTELGGEYEPSETDGEGEEEEETSKMRLHKVRRRKIKPIIHPC